MRLITGWVCCRLVEPVRRCVPSLVRVRPTRMTMSVFTLTRDLPLNAIGLQIATIYIDMFAR